MHFNFKEETCELSLVAACLARCKGAPGSEVARQGPSILKRMIDEMDATEMVEYHRLYETLEFGDKDAAKIFSQGL